MQRTRWLALPAALLATGLIGPTAASAHKPVGETTAPVIENPFASHIGEHNAVLEALIKPGALKTNYQIWVSYAPCQGGAGECPKPIQEVEIGKGMVGARKAREAKHGLGGLSPGCQYFFWFVATNSKGTTESAHAFFSTEGPEGPKECKG